MDPFQVAMTFMDRLEKQQISAALHGRMAQLKMYVETMGHLTGVKHAHGAPQHVKENLGLQRAMFQAQLDWVERAIPRVEADQLP
ncbi:hypothetical protein GCM10022224_059190 [Nonomuraea antimicrobica]|uniref:Uncharacterized protein n=1 Tax=Nonomuraea antimicrobica TaxID=561173 RepID=A0ABP7CEN1_9ACTN